MTPSEKIRAALEAADRDGYGTSGWYSYLDRRWIEAVLREAGSENANGKSTASIPAPATLPASLSTETRAKYVVDWDGVCVEERRPNGSPYWPEMGPWKPGAPNGLDQLSRHGKTVIYSLRTHLYEQDDLTLRLPGEAEKQEGMIREKLDRAGLYRVEVYPVGRGKPPGEFYLDDRAVRFTNWTQALGEMLP